MPEVDRRIYVKVVLEAYGKFLLLCRKYSPFFQAFLLLGKKFSFYCFRIVHLDIYSYRLAVRCGVFLIQS